MLLYLIHQNRKNVIILREFFKAFGVFDSTFINYVIR